MSGPEPEHLRIVEALLFASPDPLAEADIAARLPEGTDIGAILAALGEDYAGRGIRPVSAGGRWSFRTAPDLAPHLKIEMPVRRRITRAMAETLAVIAYHQPVTRSEIEDIRGTSLSRDTLEALIEAEWVRPGRRRDTPGRPLTWVTTDGFLQHFGLDRLADLPGIEELRQAGFLDRRSAVAVATATPGDGLPDEEAQPDLPFEPLVPDGEDPPPGSGDGPRD